MVRQLAKSMSLIAIGGTLYYSIEVVFRGFSHPSMFFVGGFCFWGIGLIGRYVRGSLLYKGFLGAMLVTAAELASGAVVNIWLGLSVWDYSARWGNLWGQICPLFTLIWIPIAMLGIVVSRYVRRHMWQEMDESDGSSAVELQQEGTMEGGQESCEESI